MGGYGDFSPTTMGGKLASLPAMELGTQLASMGMSHQDETRAIGDSQFLDEPSVKKKPTPPPPGEMSKCYVKPDEFEERYWLPSYKKDMKDMNNEEIDEER